MANYTKSVDFAAKDSLVTGDVNKRIRGTEINTEFNNIATAIGTKLDTTAFTATNLTGGVVAIASGGTGSSSTQYCSLTANVSGTLPVANGGTGVTTLGGTNQLLYTLTANNVSGLSVSNSSALVTSNTGSIGWTVGSVANRVLRTDGSNISFAQVNVGTDVTGTLAVANGGTGGTDAATARTNLSVPSTTGSGASGTWAIDISGNANTATTAVSISGSINGSSQITGSVGIANGGTGQTTVANAANALGVPGAGQIWQSFIASRAINTNYQNTTGRPIMVSVAITTVAAGATNPTFWVSTTSPATGGTVVSYFSNATVSNFDVTVGPIIVPDTHYYQVQAAVGSTLVYWAELR